MIRFTTALALVATLLTTNSTFALPGPAPFKTAIAEYDFHTGQIVVSYNDVITWFVKSASASFTADAPLGLPLVAGNLVSDNDTLIGEGSLSSLGILADHNLGNVAQPSLPLDDLTIHWNPALGIPLQSAPVVYINTPGNDIPEPTTLALATIALLGVGYRRRE